MQLFSALQLVPDYLAFFMKSYLVQRQESGLRERYLRNISAACIYLHFFSSLYFSGYSFCNCLIISCAFSGSIFCNIASNFFSSLCSLSLDCGEPTYSRNDSPPTCHMSCKNSDCQFSIVSLIVWLK